MIIIRNFIIQKSNKQSDKAPDRRISTKIGDNWVEIASGWVKKNKNNVDYVSAKMSKPYKNVSDDSKSRQGYVVVPEDELRTLFAEAGLEYPEESNG